MAGFQKIDFGVSSAFGAENTKIDFLKARRWRAFKKSICIMSIAAGLKVQNGIAILYFCIT
ncbi:MAG: hypothetical protein ACKO7R_00870, partial [Pseudanabaena sp.]